MTTATERKIPPVLLENREIIFRNFSGLEGRFNNAGNRNFCVKLSDAEAERMLADGWNVKWLQPREEGDNPQAYLKIRVKYSDNPKAKPPRVILITKRGKTPLDESMINILDWAEITNVDLIFRGWAHGLVHGRDDMLAAYVNSIYVTIREDALEQKYADVPDSAQNSIAVHDENVIDEEKPPWEG
jgi:hypothetical protein